MSHDALDALTSAGIAATVADSFGPVTIDVPAESWVPAHEVLRDAVGFTFFDFLSAADELTDGFRVVSHLADFCGGSHVEHVLVRTLIPRDKPVLATLSEVYAGANWHERETFEMFGITFEDHPNLIPLLLPDGFEGNPLRKEFILASRVAKPWPGAGWHERETFEMFGIVFDGHPNLVPLLLPDGFEGHPLRKEFILAARVAKAWPGAKEPGESEHGTAKRAPMRPPGVPDPAVWGPDA